MRLRNQALGTRNMVGDRVELARKQKGMKQKELLAQLQVRGIDMNASRTLTGGKDSARFLFRPGPDGSGTL